MRADEKSGLQPSDNFPLRKQSTMLKCITENQEPQRLQDTGRYWFLNSTLHYKPLMETPREAIQSQKASDGFFQKADPLTCYKCSKGLARAAP